jgi:putative redox protein
MTTVEINKYESGFWFVAKDDTGEYVYRQLPEDEGDHDPEQYPERHLLIQLGRQSASTINTVLKRQKQAVYFFKVTITGDHGNEEAGTGFERIHLCYEIDGFIQKSKAVRACTQSIEENPWVQGYLKENGTQITWELKFNERNI